jgi:enoyl-CoA hydratase/carnithine racemase
MLKGNYCVDKSATVCSFLDGKNETTGDCMNRDDTITISHDGALAIVTINRPEQKNAMSLDVLDKLCEVAANFQKRSDVSAVILTGAAGCFSAGVDLSDPRMAEVLTAPLAEKRKLMEYGPRMCRLWEEMDPITICAIEGFCVGGGVSLACACDFRVMAESAFMRVPEIGLAMNMSWATIPRLVHLVGPARTKEIVLFGERVYAKDAYAWGFAQRICPDNKAMDEAGKIADKILALPPLPAAMTKQTVNAVTSALDRSTAHMDVDQFVLTLLSEDFKEGIEAYLQKRKPKFTGK